jgi:signal transduction histidine kinase
LFSLRTNSDHVEELFAYLADFGIEFFQELEIEFDVESEITQNDRLPYYWNRQIIMILKEAMTNAARHSKAKKVILGFRYQP